MRLARPPVDEPYVTPALYPEENTQQSAGNSDPGTVSTALHPLRDGVAHYSMGLIGDRSAKPLMQLTSSGRRSVARYLLCGGPQEPDSMTTAALRRWRPYGDRQQLAGWKSCRPRESGSLYNFKPGDELSSESFATLGFEDLFGGGDRDYNDANFQLESGIGNVARVPQPGSLILLVVGMSGLGLVSRALFTVRCREDDKGSVR